MSLESGNSVCEHEWEEYDDPAAYNDGFNCPVVAICKHCGAEEDIRHKYKGANSLKWYEALLAFPVLLIIVFLSPVFTVITLVVILFTPETKAGR